MRYCFRSDDSCHNYLIPAQLSNQFYIELNKAWDDPGYKFDELFSQYRCDSHMNWSFEDPKEDM